jgi:ATP-dependent RNA helicase RhlE
VNFDVPMAPEDYIHRVGRTARAEMTGEAFTFVSPDEADDLRQIERAVGKALPRVTLPDFDYNARPAAKLEIPIAERIAKIREQKRGERARAKEKADRRAGAGSAPSRSGGAGGSAGGGGSSDPARKKRRRRRGGGGSGGGGRGGSQGPSPSR